jgi:protein TonB
VELSDTPAAEANVPEQVQPGPLQIESKAVLAPEPVPEKMEEQPVLPVSDAPDTEEQRKPEPPKEKPEEQSVGQIAMAPQVQAEKIGTAAAPQQGSTARVETDATPKWIGKISVLLERHKRYPEAARRRREAGVTAVAFSVNRSGQVLTSRIIQSSGSAVLDNEALATLMRVQPLPQVPAGIPGDTVDVTISLRFEHR